MNLITDLLKIASVVFTGIGSYFWIRRNVWSSPLSIAELAKTKCDYNDAVVKEFSGQRADSLIAWLYIFLATLAQAILFFIPVRTPFASPIPLDFSHLIYVLIMVGSLIIIGNFVSRKTEKILIKKTINLVEKNKSDNISGKA